jgi:hypothetical protein
MKEFPLLSVIIDRELKDTGQPGRPFFAKVKESTRVRFLGLLIFKTVNNGNFPSSENKP